MHCARKSFELAIQMDTPPITLITNAFERMSNMIIELFETAELCGSFRFGTKTDVTDPCYDKEVWCRKTVDTVAGEYHCYVKYEDEGRWGKRVAAIFIEHQENVIGVCDVFSKIGEIGVDAGLAGFFNNKPDYNDEEWYKLCASLDEHEGDRILGKEVPERVRFHFNECGFFSDSGYGDGTYELFGRKTEDGAYDALCIVFIYPEDYEDEDDE